MTMSHDCWDFFHSECTDDECTCWCHEDEDVDPDWAADVVVADTRGLL